MEKSGPGPYEMEASAVDDSEGASKPNTYEGTASASAVSS